MSKISKPKCTALFIFPSVLFNSMASNLSENHFLWDNLTLPLTIFFLLANPNLMPLCFLVFSIVFPNTELFISHKKSFSKSCMTIVLNSVFISMYSFSHSTMLSDWTQLLSSYCEPFLVLAHDLIPAWKLIFAWHIYQCII